MEYAQATKSDLDKIQLLLKRYDLPASDCSPHLDNFITAKENGVLVAVGGFEHSGQHGLLRSFAVHQKYRGRGIAEHIFKALCERAATLGISGLYLLTTTASDYFERLGFTECAREDCPESIKQTKQFSELCPDSAITMFRAL